MVDINFGEIHHRGFELCLNDLRMLRGMYRKINPDVSYASLNKLPRNFLIDKILIDEFSPRVMAKYRKYCEMLDKYEKIANGCLSTKDEEHEFENLGAFDEDHF